jgi:hypothetical protein
MGRMVFSCPFSCFPEIYVKVYPDWTCGTPTPISWCSVGLSSVSPGVYDLWAWIATLLSIEDSRGVSPVPCISPSNVGSPSTCWYVPSVIASPVFTHCFILSFMIVLAVRTFLEILAFCANMVMFCLKILSKKFLLSYCVIAMVPIPTRAISMVRV